MVEGVKVLSEALAAGVPVEAVFAAPGSPPELLERVAGTVTPQPVLAVAPYLDVDLDRLEQADLVVVCVDVRDPGHAGPVLRSAEAAGAGGVVWCNGSVDVYNNKAVRASAG